LNNLIVASSPHIKHEDSVPNIMYKVILALVPAAVAGVIFFGARVALIYIVSILTSIITECFFQKIRKRPITIEDGSVIVTGLLLALTLPPFLPLWMVAVGAIVSIVLGKLVYGGLGSNIFNPALVGRAFLLITFPVAMTTWTAVDALSSATPLNLLKMQGVTTEYLKLFLGNIGGSLGETSAVAILIGGAYLLLMKLIDWRIPTAFLGTTAIIVLIAGRDPIIHLLTGGLLLGAFFMATDMVTTPLTKKGKWIFGVGCGLITALVRLYGGYPEGVMFSILLMNSVTPVINRYTRPKMYGRVKLNG